jgi:anti-sigma regulatory factor (Ser/Thr protein kinase)
MTVEIQELPVGADDHDHIVHFYERDHELCRTVAMYLVDAIEAGGVAIAIATDAHRRGIEAELEAAGVELAAASRAGALVLRDAAETMATFMSGGGIDRDAFQDMIGSILRRAAEPGGPVRAYGEMVALLWDAGDVPGALEVEELWNELAADHAFSLLCGYHSDSVSDPEHADALRQVCHLHSSVIQEPSPAELSERFPADPDSARAARRFVTDALRRWGLDGALLDDAQLVLSELATNAVIHARSELSVGVSRTSSGVRVTVRDASQAQPTVRDEPAKASGRGLRLVSALASSWGVEPAVEGKVVWAELSQ